MGKSKRASAQARGTANPGPRSGTGAGSALAEMLRRQAQNPRPGIPATQPARPGQDGAPKPRDSLQHEADRNRH